MSVDPTDPDTFEDVQENAGRGAEPEETADPEAPEADAAEQQAEVEHQRDELPAERGSAEVDPADAAEQSRVVELNEDEYR
ncbi:hypothetical protein DEH18_28130 [Streptomyces sp. NHF165]|uniref:hypothetical protein n=1 Tax=Streptomyces sp. NHF165 TaxID=2175864 RepID=UPI00132E8943|nr:hypothetical protein [Streptomyces sp. NHF165]QHF97070.1 hypothetical protein DEH18_28130 [Streptomyces sp. NHF165]